MITLNSIKRRYYAKHNFVWSVTKLKYVIFNHYFDVTAFSQ